MASKVAFSGLPGTNKLSIALKANNVNGYTVSTETVETVIKQLIDCKVSLPVFQGIVFWEAIRNEQKWDKADDSHLVLYDGTWFEQLIFAYLYRCLDWNAIETIFGKFIHLIKPYKKIVILSGGEAFFPVWKSMIEKSEIAKNTILKYCEMNLKLFYLDFEKSLRFLIMQYRHLYPRTKIEEINLKNFIDSEGNIQWNAIRNNLALQYIEQKSIHKTKDVSKIHL